MTDTQHTFVATHYAPRATSYLTSAVHSGGADLDQIETMLRGQSQARVLDLGCGGGHVSYRAAPHVAEVVACDLTADMVAQVARTAEQRGLRNIVAHQAAAERLPFDDAAFDFVLCRFTAHHWLHLDAGLSEARRVLKRTGHAVFIDVIAPAHPLLDTHFQTLELLRDPSHVRNYTLAEWTAALARAGFSPTGVTRRTLRMEFEEWTARTHTPDLYRATIQRLQAQASPAVRNHFAIGEDGSFDLESLTLEATASPPPF